MPCEKSKPIQGSFEEGIRGTSLIVFYELLLLPVPALAQKQVRRRPRWTPEWKGITMSWQVEQLKEELSSKEAQGEELKKRAAGLQAEVFAVRFTLCGPWSRGGTRGWLWVLPSPSAVGISARRCTNQPALLFNRLLFSPCVQSAVRAPEGLSLVLHRCSVTAWMALQSLFFFSPRLLSCHQTLDVCGWSLSLLRYKECADVLGPWPRVCLNLTSWVKCFTLLGRHHLPSPQ